MSSKAYECPECEGTVTERVHTERYTHMIEEVYICNECPTQYTIEYDNPVKQVDMVVE